MNGIRIAMVCGFAARPKGTLSARALPMARALKDRGHEVAIFAPPYDNPEDSGRIVQEDEVAIHNIRLSFLPLAAPLVNLWRLVSAARVFKPDLVHVFKPKGYSGAAGVVLRLFSSVPVVLDHDDWEGKGGWIEVLEWPWILKKVIDVQERIGPGLAHSITVASRTLQTQLWARGISPEKIFYVPNGPREKLRNFAIDPLKAEELRCKFGLSGHRVVIFVGHLSPEDDIDILLESVRFVRMEDCECKCLIVGDGPTAPGLKRMAAEKGIEDSVLFTGWVDHEEIPALLSLADVAAYPYRDNLRKRAKCAGKIHEYMAAGKAILTHRVGQNTEYLEQGISGYLVEPEDEEGFSRGLLKLLRDEELRKKLGENARKRVRQKFDWSCLVLRVEAAYQKALAAGKTGRE